MNKQTFQQETYLALTRITSRFQLQPLKHNLAEFIKWYGIDRLYKKLHSYATKAAYLIWIALLPCKSLRNGCMPSKIRLSEV